MNWERRKVGVWDYYRGGLLSGTIRRGCLGTYHPSIAHLGGTAYGPECQTFAAAALWVEDRTMTTCHPA